LLTLAALRSLFGSLKRRQLIFADPTRAIDGRHAAPPPALPVDAEVLAGLLERIERPEDRLVALLTGVHALGLPPSSP
jgi:hypothetical protein